MQDAILRNLQVLCESAQRLSGECKAQHPEVDWRAMSGFRNVLAHDYFGIDFGVTDLLRRLDRDEGNEDGDGFGSN